MKASSAARVVAVERKADPVRLAVWVAAPVRLAAAQVVALAPQAVPPAQQAALRVCQLFLVVQPVARQAAREKPVRARQAPVHKARVRLADKARSVPPVLLEERPAAVAAVR
ncbi:MAG TPA: hypothetical protein VF193_14915 [Steroidobacter sp.]